MGLVDSALSVAFEREAGAGMSATSTGPADGSAGGPGLRHARLGRPAVRPGHAHTVGFREAVAASAFYVGVAVGFEVVFGLIVGWDSEPSPSG
jgi:hypothetical protein